MFTSDRSIRHSRRNLQSWLPHELWNEINPVLVGFGQVRGNTRIYLSDRLFFFYSATQILLFLFDSHSIFSYAVLWIRTD